MVGILGASDLPQLRQEDRHQSPSSTAPDPSKPTASSVTGLMCILTLSVSLIIHIQEAAFY